MKFHDLTVDNFLAITHAKINLSDRGLVLVEGVNNADTSAKSNGAGKSSIADALCWVWFGTTARGESGDDVVNDKSGKNCSVSSVVVDGGLTYTATRHRKHKTGKNTLTISVSDGFKTTDLTKGTEKLTQDVANQIIGSSLEVFAGSIYAGQEKMPDLPAMTDKTLKVLIEEAAGVTALENAYKKAREDALVVQGALTMAQGAIAKVFASRDGAEVLIDNLTTAEQMWVQSNANKIATLTDTIKKVSKVEYDNLVAQITSMKGYDYPAQIAAIDARIAAVGGEQKKLAELSEEVTKLGATVTLGEAMLRTFKQNVKNAEIQLNTVEHKIGCPCDSCGRPLTDAEMAGAKAAASLALSKLQGEMKAHEDVLENHSRRLHKSAVEALDAFRATMTDVSAEYASRDALTRSLGTLTAKEAQAEALLKQIRADVQRIKDIQAEVSPYKPQIEAAQKNLDAFEAQILADKGKIEKLQREVEIMGEVVKVFSPAGVRARVLDEVTPYLNAQTSKYLSIMSDGNIEAIWTTLTKDAKGNFKEKFSIDVTNATGGKKFGLISGGEKRKVRISTALALQDLVATRATKPIDIFIGDEIDDALDSAGLERLMIILEEKARERGSVFIISHNELRDHIRNVITIEKSKTGETIVTESVS